MEALERYIEAEGCEILLDRTTFFSLRDDGWHEATIELAAHDLAKAQRANIDIRGAAIVVSLMRGSEEMVDGDQAAGSLANDSADLSRDAL